MYKNWRYLPRSHPYWVLLSEKNMQRRMSDLWWVQAYKYEKRVEKKSNSREKMHDKKSIINEFVHAKHLKKNNWTRTKCHYRKCCMCLNPLELRFLPSPSSRQIRSFPIFFLWIIFKYHIKWQDEVKPFPFSPLLHYRQIKTLKRKWVKSSKTK